MEDRLEVLDHDEQVGQSLADAYLVAAREHTDDVVNVHMQWLVAALDKNPGAYPIVIERLLADPEQRHLTAATTMIGDSLKANAQRTTPLAMTLLRHPDRMTRDNTAEFLAGTIEDILEEDDDAELDAELAELVRERLGLVGTSLAR